MPKPRLAQPQAIGRATMFALQRNLVDPMHAISMDENDDGVTLPT